MDFNEFNLSTPIVDALAMDNITAPTQVQISAIPPIIRGEDVILQSETGSGKTLAYLLPIYQKQGPTPEKGTQVIIVVPTKELAMQIHHEIQKLSTNSAVALKSAVIFGDVNIDSQIVKLREKPQIIVGTSDRILTLIKRKKIAAHTVKTWIVDEADRLLDKQNLAGLETLRKTFMRDIQSIFVSATFSPKNLEQIAQFAPNCAMLQTAITMEIPETISHYFFVCERRDKLENLRKLVRIMDPDKSLVFINQLEEITMATVKLSYHNLQCACIHSDTSKVDRQMGLQKFADKKIKILVATDLAARGLHIEDVTAVFHISIAEEPIDFLHRAGRTGRKGTTGMSVCVVTENEKQYLTKYQNRFGISMSELKMKNGEIFATDKANVRTLLYRAHN